VKTGIIVPTRGESAAFRETLDFDRPTRVNACVSIYRRSRAFGGRVILARCGVGKVNSAVCAQLLVTAFGVDAVVLGGVAGAACPTLDVGDVVISRDAVHCDVDATALGFKPGHIAYYRKVFPADSKLAALAKRASRKLARSTASTPSRPAFHTRVGRILTADSFIGNRKEIRRLHRDFGGLCVEMEGASVGQTCVLNDVPFVIVRAICDKGDGGDFEKNLRLASGRAAQVVREILATM